MKWLLTALALLFAVPTAPAHAQGTIPVAMNIQSDANGRPLAGALLYLYVIGTVATPQLAFQDVNLTQALPWPIPADQVGRLPMFYLPAGSVHIRLTDSAGSVQFDYPNVLVIGGTTASTGGGGGPTIDPTAIATTGDIKFHLTSDTLSGWVILNGNSIGNATSGATSLASATTQALFVYLWTQCASACPVAPGGRGTTALADYNASKRLSLPDMRGYMAAGRDCMGAACVGRIPSIVAIGAGSPLNDQPNNAGGTANSLIQLTHLPGLLLPFQNAFVPSGQGSHFHTYTFGQTIGQGVSGAATGSLVNTITGTNTSASNLPEMAVQGAALLAGNGTLLPTISPFKLGTFYMKL